MDLSPEVAPRPKLPHVRSNPVKKAQPLDDKSTVDSKHAYTKTLTPREYAEAVFAHSKQGTESSLYPGHNFGNLASYLRRPFDKENSRRPSPSPTSRTHKHPYSFLSLYTLYPSGGKVIEQIESPERLESSQAASNNGEKSPSHILFLRGQPCSEWLSAIGARYRIDPEFFQRHLDFRSTIGRLNYFPLPSLPSTSNNFIRLRFVTIGHWEGHRQGSDQKVVDALRQDSTKAIARYLHNLNLTMETEGGLGNSIVRAFSIHDETHFTIEQAISICINRTAGRWTALVWLDTGKDLTQGPEGPWLKPPDHRNLTRTSFYPTIQLQPWVALKSHRTSIDHDTVRAGRFAQSSSLLHLDYGKCLDTQLMACDPFYAMHELFLFCAFSEVQILNMLESKLSTEPGSTLLSSESFDQSNILYTQEILEAHADRLRENIETIKSRGGPTWPRPADATMQQKSLAATQSLLKDYEHLLTRTETLSASCKSRMNVLMNRAMIAESKKAIIQAQEVTKLTRLAFVYIPLSFTASFFGMNLGPIVNGARNSLWLWLVVSVPVLVVSLVVMKWDFQELWRKINRSDEKASSS